MADQDIHEVCRRVGGVAGRFADFEVDVKGVKVVPPSGPPHMIWACVEDATGNLTGLQQSLADELSGMGLREENHAYKPHITIARIKYIRDVGTLREAASGLAERDFGVQHVEQVVVYSSQLTREGPVYAPISRSRLAEE